MYHDGEKAIQKKVGEEIIANSNGRVISDSIMKGAINFIEKQPMAVVSSADRKGKIWTSILIGDYGFVSVPSTSDLSINKELVYSSGKDVFFENISHTKQIGTLFIELATRRRFRINGTVREKDNQIHVSVGEAYPNCPKYIQQRVMSSPQNFTSLEAKVSTGTELTAALKIWIGLSDTMFVGSQSQSGLLDASHRGGKKGFVEIMSDSTLKIPDYQGNSMYNTLGNFTQNPKAGLLFIDFENRRTLQLTGKAKLLFDQNSEQDMKKTAGTGRFWEFETEEWIVTEDHHLVNWEFLNYSPFNP